MGRVYKVIDKDINEKVALKLLKPEISLNKETVNRFKNELRTARKISHKNVCRMYHLGRYEETRFITMEYVSGEDLKTTIRRVGPLSAGKTVKIAKQICEGLSEAHQMGIVHRDLKLQNIMIDRKGDAKIMDFGIARSMVAKGITETGIMIGTPEYMSPEQVEGKDIDQRSDIYSLGVICYELVTGDVPFKGNTPFSIALKHKNEMPVKPKEINEQIPDELSRIILKCMEKDREKRYQNIKELLLDLENVEELIDTTKKLVPQKKTGETTKKRGIRSNSRLIFYIISGTVLLGGLLVIGYLYLNQSKPSDEFIIKKGKSEKVQKSPEPKVPKEEEIKNTIVKTDDREKISSSKDVYEEKEKKPGEIQIKKEEEKELSDDVSKRTKKESAIVSSYGMVDIKTKPQGAEMFVDNKFIGTTPIKHKLDPGKHEIKIRKTPDFKEINKSFEVKEGEVFSEIYTLERAEYSVSINTNPSSANVFIDEKLIGKSPVITKLVFGNHRIKIERKNYKTLKEVINIESNFNKTYNLAKLEIVKISIIVHPYAEVFIDGKYIGEVPPIKSVDITEGKHSIQFVSKRLNKDISKDIEIKSGEKTELKMNMITEEIKIKK
jgi:serine/threonine protein kinase